MNPAPSGIHRALWLACLLSFLGACSAGLASQIVAWGAGTTNTGQYPDLGQSIIPPDLTNAIAVAGGDTFSLALRDDGTVLAWGDNSAGQTNAPAGLTNVVAIAAGYSHALALRAEGSVAAWGSDSFRQIDVPPDLTNAVAIAAGQYHSLALRTDGTVSAWGDNTAHQTDVPPGLSNVVAIAVGRSHCVALRADGSVCAWGDNSSGQSSPPVGLNGIAAIAAGDMYSLALKASGTLVAWGSQTNDPAMLALPPATVISTHRGTAATSHNKATAQDGNVAFDWWSGSGPLVVDGGVGWAALANGRVNVGTNYARPPCNLVSMTNWGIPNQIPDYTTPGAPNALFDINRLIALADATPNGPSPTGNNHFTNIGSFVTAMSNYPGGSSSQMMQGAVVVDVRDTDPSQTNLTSKHLPRGINVEGMLLFNFLGDACDFCRIVTDAAFNINPADLTHLVSSNPATYLSGFPPVYADPTKNPVNLNIAPAYPNFMPEDVLPALVFSGGYVDFLGGLNVCGLFYSTHFVDIENIINGTTQYVRGSIITGAGAFLENRSLSMSIFSYEPSLFRYDPGSLAVAACATNCLALRRDGTIFTWSSAPKIPSGLSNVVAMAAGVSHSLALVGDGSPPPATLAASAAWTNNRFSLSVPTKVGHVYTLEYKSSPADNHWIALPLSAGRGGPTTVTDTTASAPQRFYRVVQW